MVSATSIRSFGVVGVFALAILLAVGFMSLGSQVSAQGTTDYDVDDDGLIEVSNLAQLNAMRWDLDGNGFVSSGDRSNYNAAFPNATSVMGCPDGLRTACKGYELTANLDFDTNGNGQADSGDDYWNSGWGWDPIDNNNIDGYAAIFEGNGYVISNLFINAPTVWYQGLFGLVTETGRIRNLGLEDVDITGSTSTGALVGRLYGQVERSYATGSVTGRLLGGYHSAGGLVAEVWDNGSIKRSYARVDVKGYSFVGGLAGANYGVVEDSYATGSVTSSNSSGGGLVGTLDGQIGALIGQIRRSYATGVLLGSANGGLLGHTSGGTCTDSYWNTETSGKTSSLCGTGKTTEEMAVAKTSTNLYANWNSNVWDLATLQYPALKTDWDGDGTATWPEFGVQRPVVVDYDGDGDGLLEVSALAQLNAMRWDLDGDGAVSPSNQASYAAAFPDATSRMGCPIGGCSGYELSADLDFDTNGDGRADQPKLTPGRNGCRPDRHGNWPIDHRDCGYDDYWNDGSGWDPIDNYATTFDGNGHAIRNLFIDRPTADDVGLFGSLTSNGAAEDVGLSNLAVTGNDAVGGLVGESSGIIRGSYASGEIEGGDNVGGLVGENSGILQVSYASGEVEGDNDVGGLAGQNLIGATIRQSYSQAFVTGTADRVGGLAGRNKGTIERSYAIGEVDGKELVGGLVGENTSSATIKQGYSTGDVTGDADAGGLVGKNDSGTCQDSYWDTEASGHTTSGCGTGKTTDEMVVAKTATNLYSLWDEAHWVTGDWQYPTLKADWDGDGTATWREFGEQRPFLQDGDGDRLIDISNVEQLSAMRWDLTGKGYSGGVLGDEYRAESRYAPSISTCPGSGCLGYELVTDLDFDTDGDGAVDSDDVFWNDGAGWDPIDGFGTTLDGDGHTIANLFIDRSSENKVGLFALMTKLGEVKDLGLDDIDVTGHWEVGGLVGYNEGAIARSYVAGDVAGRNYTGGLVGDNRPSAAITVSYSTAAIDGRSHAGGLAGRNIGIIEDSYTTGAVSGHTELGGVVGHNNDILNPSICENVARRTFATGLITAGTPFYGGVAMVAYAPYSTCPDSFWDTQTTGTDWSACGEGYTTAQLQTPTSATGIYVNWPASVWDFRSSTQYPALKADWDGDGTATWQEFGNQGPTVVDKDSDDDLLTKTSNPAQLTALSSSPDGVGANAASWQGIGFQNQTLVDYDYDDDGLIEISKLDQLNAMRWDLNGDGAVSSGDQAKYAAAFPNSEAGMGCPSGGCTGYELSADLDFDTNGDGSSHHPKLPLGPHGCRLDRHGNWPIDHPDCGYDDYWNDGLGWAPIANFAATFEGNGHTIDNLFIDRPNADNVGLFGSLTTAGTARDVELSDVRVTGGDVVGGLVGENSGVVKGSHVWGEVEGGNGVGVLAGLNQETIEESYTNGEVKGSNDVGGLVGRNLSGATIRQSYTLASVTGTADKVGGLTGRNQGTIERGYAIGEVNGDELVGGLVGENTSSGTIRQGYATGDVTGDADAGGLVGKNDSGTCQDSYWDTEASGYTTSACGTGKTTDELVAAKTDENLYALWDEAHWATGDWQYPTLKADWDGDGTATWREFGEQRPFLQDGDGDRLIDISNLEQLSAIRWDVTGKGYLGGVNGDEYRAASRYAPSISTCPGSGCLGYELVTDLDFDTNGDGAVDSDDVFWNEGAGWDPIDGNKTTLDGDGHTIANLFISRGAEEKVGLFGSQTHSGVVRKLGLDDVHITGSSVVGSVVGYNEGTIEQTYVTGKVKGSSNSGGLAGENRTGSRIRVSYSAAEINCAWRAGGLAGRNMGIIEDSYSTGPVTGYSDLGGVVGHNNEQPNRSPCRSTARRTFATGLITGGTPFYGGIAMVSASPNASCPDSFWDTETTGTDWSACGEGYTTAQLQTPTSATGIYVDWNADVWDFGKSDQYPAIKADWDGDGIATAEEFGPQRYVDYDRDGDGLLEVSTLAQLNAMRWDLDGDGSVADANQSSYQAAFFLPTPRMGCPSAGCDGYELTADLDFDTNGNDHADAGDAYWNGGAGWTPIANYVTTFDGNGHAINNLYIDRTGAERAGLFSHLTDGAEVRNLALLDVDITANNDVGAFAGLITRATLRNSYATGSVTLNSAGDSVGGLVGEASGHPNGRDTIRDSYSLATVRALALGSYAGGLAGSMHVNESRYARIVNTFAAGAVFSPDLELGGGLVGHTKTAQSRITDSYWDTQTTGWSASSDDGDDVADDGLGKMQSELHLPTSATGIYASWDSAVWDFGSNSQYPALKFDTDGDGIATVAEFGSQPRTAAVPSVDLDADNDALIEVSNLDQLNAIRWDLDGNGQTSSSHEGDYNEAFTGSRSALADPCFGVACHGYELTANLDFDTNGNGEADAGDKFWNGGAGWAPIGRHSNNHDTEFNATFEGNGHTIGNLFIQGSGSDSLGLFGATEGSSNIRNLGLLNAQVNGTSGDDLVGGLVGFNKGKIGGSHVTGSVTGDDRVGGLAGSSWNRITDSHTAVSVTGNDFVGGLTGVNSHGTGSSTNGTITRSHATGSVTGHNFVGGLSGSAGDAIIASYATGAVTANDYVGGLAGQIGGAITASYATGPVTSQDNTGGLVGLNYGRINLSFATGTVAGDDNVGGLVGANGHRISDSYATGSVSGDHSIGGLVGKTGGSNAYYISDSYATGSVTGISFPGGLVGRDYGGTTIADSYWDTETSGQSGGQGGAGKTTAELQSPTSASGIYADWNAGSWDFGGTAEYPRLKAVLSFSSFTVANQSYISGSAINALQLPRASGGNGSLTYMLEGALPIGLSFDATARTITGTPMVDADEVSTHTYRAADADGNSASLDFTISVELDRAPNFGSSQVDDQRYRRGESITTLQLPGARDGNGQLIYALVGDLPEGLSYDAVNRRISGKPTVAMESTEYAYSVTDADGDVASLTFAIEVMDYVVLGAADGYVEKSRVLNEVSWLRWDTCNSNQRCGVVSTAPEDDRLVELTMVLEPGAEATVQLWLFRHQGGSVGLTQSGWTKTFNSENRTHVFGVAEDRADDGVEWSFRLSDPADDDPDDSYKIMESHVRVYGVGDESDEIDHDDFTRWWEYDVFTHRWQWHPNDVLSLIRWHGCERRTSADYDGCVFEAPAGHVVDWYVGVKGNPTQRLSIIDVDGEGSDAADFLRVREHIGPIEDTPGPGAFVQGTHYVGAEDAHLGWRLCVNETDGLWGCMYTISIDTQIALRVRPATPHRPADRTVRYEADAAVLEFTSPDNVPITYARGRVGNDACQGWGSINTEDGRHLLTHVGGNNYEVRIPYASYGMHPGSNRCVDVKPCNESGCYYRDGHFRDVIRPQRPQATAFEFVGDRTATNDGVDLELKLTPGDANFSRIDGFWKRFTDQHGSNCHDPAHSYGPILPSETEWDPFGSGSVKVQIPYADVPGDRSYCMYVQVWNDDGTERIRRWTKVDVPAYQ